MPGGAIWSPSFTIAYERLLGDDNTSANVSLAGSPVTFTSRGTTEDRNRLRLGSVSSFAINERASVVFATDSVYSSDRKDYSAKLGLKIEF